MSETTAGGLLWEALAGDEQARKRQFITQVRRAAELSRENESLTARLAEAEAALARIALSQTGDECESDFAQDFLGWKSTSELWDIIKAAKAGGGE